MAGFSDIERFGLELPEVVLHPHLGQPSLRARGRMFALWWPPDAVAILKLEREHQRMLFEVRPDVFTPCKVGTGTWSYVEISKLSRDELRALLVEAWSQVMPKQVTSTVAASPPRPRRSTAAARTGARPGPSSRAPRRRR